MPVQVSGAESMMLWAVWAMAVKHSKVDSYVGQVWEAVNHYQPLRRTMLVGDFNRNVIWGDQRKNGNHTMVENLLKRYEIESLYHLQFEKAHGAESKPTFFLTKKRSMTYYLDYCFLSADLIGKQTKLTVGDYEDWKSLNDHAPLIIDI